MKGAEFGRRWDCPKRFGFSWAFCYNFVRGRIFRAAPVGILRFRAAGGIQQHVEYDYDIIMNHDIINILSIYYQYITKASRRPGLSIGISEAKRS